MQQLLFIHGLCHSIVFVHFHSSKGKVVCRWAFYCYFSAIFAYKTPKKKKIIDSKGLNLMIKSYQSVNYYVY